jgi:hypothetical protein
LRGRSRDNEEPLRENLRRVPRRIGDHALRAGISVGSPLMVAFFICYRREDTAGYAGWLSDSLRGVYGKESVFIDVHIPGGSEFPSAIARAVCACDVVIALIGASWLRSSAGVARLEDPKDFLRLELTSALAGKRHIIPVLLDHASLPSAEDLPDVLRPLLLRQAVALSGARWHSDFEALVAAIDQLPQSPRSSAKQRVLRLGAPVLLLALALLGVSRARSWWQRPAPPAPVRTVVASVSPLQTAEVVASERPELASAAPTVVGPAPRIAAPALRASASPSVTVARAPSSRAARAIASFQTTNDLYSVEALHAVADRLAAAVIGPCFAATHQGSIEAVYDISLTAAGIVVQVAPRGTAAPSLDQCIIAGLRGRSFGPPASQGPGQVVLGWSRQPGFDMAEGPSR